MDASISNGILGQLGNTSHIVGFALVGAVLMLTGFFLVKGYWRMRGNTAFQSYQMGVVAPVQYGDRGNKPEVDRFARRLEDLADEEETFEMSKLMPQARELGAIKDVGFHTAPFLEGDDVGVLGLIEEVVQASSSGCRVLVNASLERMVDLEDNSQRGRASRLSIVGIVLKFAVVDQFGRLIMAIDHMKDAPLDRQENINRTVVIEVLRKAGVWYLEVPAQYSAENARAQILAVLRRQAVMENREDVA